MMIIAAVSIILNVIMLFAISRLVSKLNLIVLFVAEANHTNEFIEWCKNLIIKHKADNET